MTFFYLYHDPAAEFNNLFEDAPATRLCPRASVSSTGTRHATSRHSDVYRPRLDLHESKDDYTVTATFELPGLTSKDVAIDIHQNLLTVSGESVSSDTQEEKSYVVRERRSGKFSRTLRLPFGTQPDDVKARMDNGVLTVTFPKTSPEQQAKRIVVQ